MFRGDKDIIPQNVLIPSIQDPKLSMVKCRSGKERDIIFTLMQRFLNLETSTTRSLKIHSAFCRNGIPGYIYIEGDRQDLIESAIQGLENVYPSTLKIVPVSEMTQCLTIKSKEKELLVNAWVRIRRGKYAGDLGQVIFFPSSHDCKRLSMWILQKQSLSKYYRDWIHLDLYLANEKRRICAFLRKGLITKIMTSMSVGCH